MLRLHVMCVLFISCAPPNFLCSTQCKTNRAAALCTQCLPNYREDVSGACTPCPQGTSVVATVFVVIAILIGVWFMFWIVLRSGIEAFNAQTAAMHGVDDLNEISDSGKVLSSDDGESHDDSSSDGSESEASTSAIDSEMDSAASGSMSSSYSEESDSDMEREAPEPSNLDPMVRHRAQICACSVRRSARLH